MHPHCGYYVIPNSARVVAALVGRRDARSHAPAGGGTSGGVSVSASSGSRSFTPVGTGVS